MSSNTFPAHWQVMPLAEAVEALIDYRGKTPKKTDSGIPLVTAKIVKGGTLSPATEYIAEENYESWMVRGLPEVGDVVVTTEAPLGEVAQLTDANVALAQRIVTLRGAKGLLLNDYLRYAMQGSYVQGQLESRASGSTVKGIKQSELRKVLLPIPSLQEQGSIATCLKAIDDKIQLNHRINQTLEQMAQAIFRSWFVDFEPVKAKIAARERWHALQPENESASPVCYAGELKGELITVDLDTYMNLAAMQVISGKDAGQLTQMQAEQPERYAELRATAKLFPSAMQDSELGDIPEGWEVVRLASLTDTVTKGTTPRKPEIAAAEDSATVLFIKVKDIADNGEILREGLELIPRSIHTAPLKRSILETDDVLFSIAGTIGRVAIVDAELHDCNTNQAVGIIRLNDKAAHLPLIWQTLKSQRVQDDIASKVVQGVQANASLANLKDIQVIMPTEALVRRSKEALGSVLRQITTNQAQNRLLGQVRDAILPKLLSGELTLPYTEVTQAELQDVANAAV
ncbi:restriction endonuclease subunit S [Marinobacterium iners]|uniref:restriction endonuclease subunit S n=1 Tax=Marinobacterium iners TaxID=48076 RepID=UPI001A905074|nr:restriction endonuclease subunit S [Marinobacterium iners]